MGVDEAGEEECEVSVAAGERGTCPGEAEAPGGGGVRPSCLLPSAMDQ